MIDTDLTPLMRQYWEIKRAYQEAILFFRVGDFYEMFHQDAIEASKILNIALTSRDKGKPNPVPLCGIPYHAAKGYIAKLLQAGRTVALCDQVEDPKLAKGLVRREVVRLYTPGTLTDSELLSPTESSILAAVVGTSGLSRHGPPEPIWGLAALELSTGEFRVTECTGTSSLDDLQDELVRLAPREVLYPADLAPALHASLEALSGARLCVQARSAFDAETAEALLRTQFKVASLETFGCEGLTVSLHAAGAVLGYLRETQPAARLDHIRGLEVRRLNHTMHLDAETIRNLELVAPLVEERRGQSRAQRTLLSVLDRTVTVMGSRLLREWIVRPLVNIDAIQARLDAVDELVQTFQARVAIRTALRHVQDIARLSSRISLGTATPRDTVALLESISVLPEIREIVAAAQSRYLQEQAKGWDDLADLQALIDKAIRPDPPVSIRDGGIIKEGYDTQLDELRKACREGKGDMATLEMEEREHTGIDSLKVRFNQVFGYYIEITKANLGRVPGHYIRRQTLANAERFTTAKLKELEDLVTNADQKLNRLEQELFEQTRGHLALHTGRLQAMAQTLASLDVLAALAEVAALYQYAKPEIHEGGVLSIQEGRHPVVERLDHQIGFIPNDALLDLEDNRLLILTGPNMAGKSTYLRQVALIVLMAHLGSFVPARSARLGLVDRIFTRVGASDNLAAGQSTFMVEMTETAKILNCATPRSLILLDEIGRGTSTYDGLSIAWAVAEFIQDRRHLGARTLFATHYHEMTQLAGLRDGIKNYTVAIREEGGEVLFLRKIIEGGADRSYGIHVARLAGLPNAVIRRAQEVLAQLEEPASSADDPLIHQEPRAQPHTSNALPSPHPIIDEVRQMDLFSMTPLDALNRLAELQRRLEDIVAERKEV